MKPPLSYIPLLPVVIGFIVGIIICDYSVSLYLAILPAAISAILLWRKYALWGYGIMAIAIGWINAACQSPDSIDESLASTPLQYTAIVEDVSESENSRHLIVNIDNIGLCSITTPSLFPAINCGDIITFTSCLEKPENRHDLPLEWDLKTYMYRKGIVATTYIRPKKISVIGRSSSLYLELQQLRQDIVSLLGQSQLSDATTAFFIATITGDSSFLSQGSRDQYARSGLAHILALSGLHVGIIATIIAIFLFPVHIMRHRKLRYIITIIFLWIYACATGLSPSVTRATIMTTLFLTALMFQRYNSSINALCFAALIILMFSPMSLFSIGFQLSFAAVAAILLFANRINPVNPRNKVGYYFMSLVTVSIAAMIGTGLISAFYFHLFPTYFLLSNIVVLSVLPFVLGGGILLTILLSIGIEASWLCHTLDYGYNLISEVCLICNSLPAATIDNIYFKPWLFIPYFITCASLLASLVYRKRILHIVTIGFIGITITLFIAYKEHYPAQETYFPRNTYYTNIIARDQASLYLYSTAHTSELPAAIDRVKTRYRDYIGSRGVDTIVMVDSIFDSRIITRRGRNLIINGNHYVIVKSNDDLRPLATKPQYALICRGFVGDITEVSRTINPDTIILSNDLHLRRNKRYYLECKQNHIPVINHRILD